MIQIFYLSFSFVFYGQNNILQNNFLNRLNFKSRLNRKTFGTCQLTKPQANYIDTC